MNYDEEIKRDKILLRQSFIEGLYMKCNYHYEQARRHRKKTPELINDLIADILDDFDRWYYLYLNSKFDVDITGELKNLWLDRIKDHD